jgi:phytoene dehydrogenase-like protein
MHDAVVIGSGPNGLAAGITLAKAGRAVKIIEAKNTIGGGMRSSELTIPGFKHDVCSSIYPFGKESLFFSQIPSKEIGLEWIRPTNSLAHPFDDGTASFLTESISRSAQSLNEDEKNYIRLMESVLNDWEILKDELLGPLKISSHPFSQARFGLKAVFSADFFTRKHFKGIKAKSLFAGLAGHSFLSLNELLSSSIGLVLGLMAHRSGWLIPKGGAQNIADKLGDYFLSLGGEIELEHSVNKFSDIPESKLVFFDITPKQILNILGEKIPPFYRKRLENYKYGSSVFKLDWALNSPVPFKSDECRKAGTIHVGGKYGEIFESEYLVRKGEVSEKPFIILTQPSLFDKTRTPENKHTAWAYCHVPANCEIDLTERIENQIERFAPGFKDTIIAKNKIFPKDLEKYNSNYIGGDINGGLMNWKQFFTRPVISFSPYNLPLKGYYICSSSTPPGGGVHGMCGYNAAKKALKQQFGL